MNDRLSGVISELSSDLESVRRIPRLRWVAALLLLCVTLLSAALLALSGLRPDV